LVFLRQRAKEHVAVSRSNLFNTSSTQSAPFYFMGEFKKKIEEKKKKIAYSAISARVITMQCNVDSLYVSLNNSARKMKL
jgi:hypothetical protein